VPVKLLQPFDEETFLARSVTPEGANPHWRERYRAVRARMPAPPLGLPSYPPQRDAQTVAANGPMDSPFEDCNHWLLNTALAYGASRLHFICLWNGAGTQETGGGATGGTAHMVREVARRGGHTHWLDTRALW
jgi:hypothetical protein